MEFEIDVDRVAVGLTKTSRKWIDSGDTLQSGKDGLVHEGIAAGFDDLRTSNRPIPSNGDLDGANKGLGLFKDRCGLFPLAEKAVMDQIMIPGKLAGIRGATF